MPMNTLERERHLRSFVSAPIQEAIALCRITIALFISAMSRSNIIGLPRRWTMDFGSRSLSKKLSSAGSSVGAQSLWERASSFSTTATNVARRVLAFNNRAILDRHADEVIELIASLLDGSFKIPRLQKVGQSYSWEVAHGRLHYFHHNCRVRGHRGRIIPGRLASQK